MLRNICYWHLSAAWRCNYMRNFASGGNSLICEFYPPNEHSKVIIRQAAYNACIKTGENTCIGIYVIIFYLGCLALL